MSTDVEPPAVWAALIHSVDRTFSRIPRGFSGPGCRYGRDSADLGIGNVDWGGGEVKRQVHWAKIVWHGPDDVSFHQVAAFTIEIL